MQFLQEFARICKNLQRFLTKNLQDCPTLHIFALFPTQEDATAIASQDIMQTTATK